MIFTTDNPVVIKDCITSLRERAPLPFPILVTTPNGHDAEAGGHVVRVRNLGTGPDGFDRFEIETSES